MSAADESRRKLLILAAAAGVSALVVDGVGSRARAADAPLLDPNDPAAKALGYTNKASAVDAKANPQFKAGSLCANCAQYTGAKGSTTGPCNIFPGKMVASEGWCRVWTPKPA